MDDIQQKINDSLIDDICFICSRYKQNKEVQQWFIDNQGLKIELEIIEKIKQENQMIIKLYNQGGSDAIQKGIELGTLAYTSLYNRIATLNDIVQQCVEGYGQEKVNGRGEIVFETVKNFGAAISAINLMSNLMQQLPKEEDYYEVVLGEIDEDSKSTVKKLSLPPSNYG